MIEHIGNCHGEWNVVLGVLGGLPVVGVAALKVRMWWRKLRGNNCNHTCGEH